MPHIYMHVCIFICAYTHKYIHKSEEATRFTTRNYIGTGVTMKKINMKKINQLKEKSQWGHHLLTNLSLVSTPHWLLAAITDSLWNHSRSRETWSFSEQRCQVPSHASLQGSCIGSTSISCSWDSPTLSNETWELLSVCLFTGKHQRDR